MSDDPLPPESPPPPPRKTGSNPVPRLPSGQHNLPRKPTGQHPLPRRPSGGNPTRPPTGSYAAGQRPPTGSYAASHHPPQRKGDNTLYYILGGVMVVVCVLYFAVRDPWERDNKTYILQLKSEADALRPTQKKAALDKYDTLIKFIGSHTLNDSEVKAAYYDARKLRNIVPLEMAEESSGHAAPATPAMTKAHEIAFAAYEVKSRPLLDALNHAKSGVDSGATQQKNRDDVALISLEFGKWWDALSEAEAGFPSAQLLSIARESYMTAGDWWQIEIDKKMPDALVADGMKHAAWAQAATALAKIKVCMDAKDFLERKTCDRCDGTGKVKCPICFGSGVCQICKGVQNPGSNCCVNGVCFACKGRKESTCAICDGSGEFPPKRTAKTKRPE